MRYSIRDHSLRAVAVIAVLFGLLGALVFWLWFGTLGVGNPKVPIVMFAGSTGVATAMLVLMNLSRFKAR